MVRVAAGHLLHLPSRPLIGSFYVQGRLLLLEAHVACLRVATPVNQLPRIDAQIAARAPPPVPPAAAPAGGEELDLFMTHYVLLLCSFKEQLQQHVRVHAMEAVMACWELEQTLQSLTGASPGEGTGATMSDDEDNPVDSESNMFDGNDVSDGMGFGMLTEGERSLVERVRQELKHELKQGYREKLVDIREEILRKRRAGKLPGDTASTLKAWWQAHAKWPYPTEEDKAQLVQETGLQLKQINNWFINQRKRNWHSNPTSSSSDKSKRKRYGDRPKNNPFITCLKSLRFSFPLFHSQKKRGTMQVRATPSSPGRVGAVGRRAKNEERMPHICT
ncbi:hypothetical protein VPH35_046342 [Triticum aestivum]